MITDDIYEYLIDQGFSEDRTFIGAMPEEEPTCISILTTASPPPNPAIGYYEQYVDFWARSRNASEATLLLETIRDLLHRKVSYNLDNHHVYLSALNGLIDDMDRDIEGRKLMRMGMRFIYRKIDDE